MAVFLDPIESGGWLGVLHDNGLAKAYAFGRYLGSRYSKFPNIIWMSGNDFQTWRTPSDDALALAVARGIKATDPNQLQTAELNFSRQRLPRRPQLEGPDLTRCRLHLLPDRRTRTGGVSP